MVTRSVVAGRVVIAVGATIRFYLRLLVPNIPIIPVPVVPVIVVMFMLVVMFLLIAGEGAGGSKQDGTKDG